MKGIGNQPINSEVVTDVKLTIWDQVYTTTLVAADIEEDMLLGIDCLSEHKAVINLSRQEVQTGDQVIVAGLIKENQERSAGGSDLGRTNKSTSFLHYVFSGTVFSSNEEGFCFHTYTGCGSMPCPILISFEREVCHDTVCE